MYTNWAIGDIVSIGVSVADFCGYTIQDIYLNSYDMELYPTALNLPCLRSSCAYSCLSTSGRSISFYSCMNYHTAPNDVNCTNRSVDKYYREINRINTDANGRALFNHTVTSQDLADYNDAKSLGGNYNIIACINDPLAANAHAANFGNINVTCPSCPPICVGSDLYNQICNQSTGTCIQGTILQSGGCVSDKGIIHFDSNPQGAEIWLAPSLNVPTDTTFQTPYTISNITPGTYNYILRKPYFDDYVNAISVAAGQTVNVFGQMIPFVTYELYYKISKIVPASLIYSARDTINSAVSSGALNVANFLEGYYIENIVVDPIAYMITIVIMRNAELVQIGNSNNLTLSGGYGNIQSLQASDSAISALASSIVLVILFALGIVSAPEAVIAYAALLAINYGIVTFLGKKESVLGQPPSTRVITLDAKICTGDTTNPCSTSSLLTDPSMIVSIVVTAGSGTPQTGSITTASPTATFSVPTNVDVSITAKVNSPYYTTFTADPASNPALKSCTPGGSCPTTIPITIKLFAQADAKVAPKVADTSGNPLPGKYVLFIEDSRGVKVEDGSGNLVNGQVPQGSIPANKEYCVAIIPSDYPTHGMVFTCTSCSAGDICSPTLTSKTCLESKNSLTVRCVYISNTGARLGFTPDEIDITDMSTSIVRKILPGTPTTGSTCTGVISSDTTCVDGLENGKTYKVSVVSSIYTVTTATQDQQVTYTTDCNTGIMLTVEASPPPNTYDITIQVQNDQTLTALPGAVVTLGTMPGETTGSDGSVMFPSVPQGTGIPLKATLTGYKDYSNKIDVTISKTVTVQMTVDQVLQTIDTRIRDLGAVGYVLAGKSVKFKGYLEYLSGTTYEPLTDAPTTVTVKDKDGNTLQTLSATTQPGVGTIGAGYFETGEWSVPSSLLNTQISVAVTFDGVGRYKSSAANTTFVVAKPADCIIPIPFTNSCLLSSDAAKTLLTIGEIVIGGYVIYKLAKLLPSKKPTEVVQPKKAIEVVPTKKAVEAVETIAKKEAPISTGGIFEIKPVVRL